MLPRKKAISRCYNFPPSLTNASALPEKMQQFRNSIISLKCCITALPVLSSRCQISSNFWTRDSYLCYCMTINLIISGVHQSHLGCWGHRLGKVKLRGLDYVAYKMCQCAVLLKEKLLSAMCSVAINILLGWQNTSLMLSIDMQFTHDEEKLPFLTWHPSGLTLQQIW